MLTFQELKITPDGNNLIIRAVVDEQSFYDNVLIDSVVIDTQDTYVSTGPSSKPIYTSKVGNKEVNLVLSTSDLGGKLDNLYFVYIIPSGSPSPDTPCGLINSYIIGTVANLYPYFQDIMKYVKEIEGTCSIPKNFIDSSLKLKALELCMRTGNYIQAVKYWNKFFKGKIGSNTASNCRCYG